MKNVKKLLVALGMSCVFISLSACSQGFNRESMQKDLASQMSMTTDANIESLYDKKPQAPRPAKLAIVLNTEMWDQEDKQKLLSTTEQLVKEGVLSDVFFLPEMLMQGRDIYSLRQAAARHQADLVFVVSSINNTDEYINPASLLYLTIVGMWLVPGSHIDSLYLAQGVLFDVRSEYIYFSVEGEGKGSTWGPEFMISRDDANKEARKECIVNLVEVLRTRIVKMVNK